MSPLIFAPTLGYIQVPRCLGTSRCPDVRVRHAGGGLRLLHYCNKFIALHQVIEWFYTMQYDKFIELCSAMSGLPSQRKIVCAVVALRSAILEWSYLVQCNKFNALYNAIALKMRI